MFGKFIAHLYYLVKFKIAVCSLQTFRKKHHGVYEQNVYSFTVLSNQNEPKHADQHLKPSLKYHEKNTADASLFLKSQV